MNGKSMPEATAEAAVALCIAGWPIVSVSKCLHFAPSTIYQAIAELPPEVWAKYLDQWKTRTVHRLWMVAQQALDRVGETIGQAGPRDAAIIAGILLDKVALLSGIAEPQWGSDRRERTITFASESGGPPTPAEIRENAKRLNGSFLSLSERLTRIRRAGRNGGGNADGNGDGG